MDGHRFDDVIRGLGGTASRRAALGLLAAIALPAGAGARSRRGPKIEGPCGDGSRKANACTSGDDCCTGICAANAGKANKDGQGRCRCVRKGGTCTEDRHCCSRRGQQMTCNPVVDAQSGRTLPEGVCGHLPPAPTCGASTCAEGCCNGDTCVPATIQGYTDPCGTGGVACAVCPVNRYCIGGECIA